MSDDLIALARRAVACKGFRWLPGMLTDKGLRVVTVNEEHRYLHVHPGSLLLPTQGYALPDLADAATIGCLLALVREAHGSLLASMVNERTNRWAMFFLGGPVVHGSTEAEALVSALESAP